jgi:alkanesulfonate monooxygenase SsuD/methylene tetrahydromethanopterin reductase-like flavin-dependent oxidoreductase (luciferase family)
MQEKFAWGKFYVPTHRELKVGLHQFGFVGETSQGASDEFWPGHQRMFTHIGKERGWPPTTREQFEATRGRTGAYLIGTAEEIVEKILRENEALGGLARITFQMTKVALEHKQMLKSIEMLGTKVVPMVRKALG